MLERFAVEVDASTLTGNRFTVTLQKSGKRITVDSNETIWLYQLASFLI